MTPRILPASDVRSKFAEVLNGLRDEGVPCFVTRNGRAEAVLMPVGEYERLMSELEDRLDETDRELALDVAAARREYRAGRSSPLAKVRR